MTTQPKTLEAALAEICEQHDLTSCVIDMNLKQHPDAHFRVSVHWDGFSVSGFGCASRHGADINEALSKTIKAAQSDRRPNPPADDLPAFEVAS